MKKSFLEWPLDGQIIFAIILLSLACLLFSKLADRRQSRIIKKTDDLIHMQPLRSLSVTLLGIILADLAITYVVAQSGHCNLRTLSENDRNQLIGIMLAAVFWIGSLFFFYRIFMVKYAFNRDKITKATPFSKKTFLWSDLSNINADWKGSYLEFKNNKKLYLSYYYSGIKQLYNILNSKIMHWDKPTIPIYNEEGTKQFLGKSIILLLFRIDEIFLEHLVKYEIGIVKDIDKEKISILLKNGETMLASANIRSIDYFDDETMEEYYDILSPFIEPDNKPEAIAIYYVS